MIDEKRVDLGSKLCICQNCGYCIEHTTRGIPCAERKCPRCGSIMSGKSCMEKNEVNSARMMKFECGDCGLLMVLSVRPVQCIVCGGSNIVRDGWRPLAHETIGIN